MSEPRPDSMPRHRRVRLSALWFGLFGGPALWSVELLVNYGIASHFCYPRQFPLSTSTFSGMRLVLGGVIVLAAAGTVAAGLTAFTNWRTTGLEPRGANSPRADTNSGTNNARIRFMAFSGILISALFLLLILLNGVPLLVVPPCSYGA